MAHGFGISLLLLHANSDREEEIGLEKKSRWNERERIEQCVHVIDIEKKERKEEKERKEKANG